MTGEAGGGSDEPAPSVAGGELTEFPVSKAEKKLILRLRSLARGIYQLVLRKTKDGLFLTVLTRGKEERLSRKTQ